MRNIAALTTPGYFPAYVSINECDPPMSPREGSRPQVRITVRARSARPMEEPGPEGTIFLTAEEWDELKAQILAS